MINIQVAGLALVAVVSAQSGTNSSSGILPFTPTLQAGTELARSGQDVDVLAETLQTAVTDASFTYVSTSSSSWASFSFEPTATRDASFTYLPSNTEEFKFVYVPTTTIEETTFVFAPSATDSVYLHETTTTELVPARIAPTSTAEQTVAMPVQQDIELSPSTIISDSSYVLGTARTMQTGSELSVPTLHASTWTSASSWAAMPTPVVNAPHVEHQAGSLQSAVPVQSVPVKPTVQLPVEVPTGRQPTQQQSPGSEFGSHQEAPTPVAPAYHEPIPAAATTLPSASSASHMAAESDAIAAQTVQSSPSRINSITFSGVSTAETLVSGSSTVALQTAPPATEPTVHVLTYQGQTIQVSGMTLAAEPTASGSSSGDSAVTSAMNPSLVDSAAVLAYGKSGVLLLAALATTIGLW
ncbi:hypothetical protein Slin15195_G010510 [Septoria linicola]|uniref:Uncharacterized protein n=1 Tax=Septoria linicola TaxID=215465 RepID=A0A9Q9EFJ1_9PEZI|nr:hypothetical protein Slin14017_G010520 [Septoria linicola]USW47732.1 hypothetical protein Slin15195_G010510 [Septoria linicola]